MATRASTAQPTRPIKYRPSEQTVCWDLHEGGVHVSELSGYGLPNVAVDVATQPLRMCGCVVVH